MPKKKTKMTKTQRIESHRESNRKWRVANPDKERESHRKWREANPEKWGEYRRKWVAANPEKARGYSRKYREANPGEAKECTRKWVDANPDSLRCYNTLNYAIQTGKFERQPCEVCGQVQVHGHHSDYSKPLEVIWLCPQHHKRLHLHRLHRG